MADKIHSIYVMLQFERAKLESVNALADFVTATWNPGARVSGDRDDDELVEIHFPDGFDSGETAQSMADRIRAEAKQLGLAGVADVHKTWYEPDDVEREAASYEVGSVEFE